MDERKAFDAWWNAQHTMYAQNPAEWSWLVWQAAQKAMLPKILEAIEQGVMRGAQAATLAERERCATLSPNGLDVLASDSPAVVWQKYSAAIRKG